MKDLYNIVEGLLDDDTMGRMTDNGRKMKQFYDGWRMFTEAVYKDFTKEMTVYYKKNDMDKFTYLDMDTTDCHRVSPFDLGANKIPMKRWKRDFMVAIDRREDVLEIFEKVIKKCSKKYLGYECDMDEDDILSRVHMLYPETQRSVGYIEFDAIYVNIVIYQPIQ